MPFMLKNNANTQSHCHREELTMQNAHTRPNPALYSVLAFSMLASTATPVWADDDQQAVRYGTYNGAVAGAAASAATVATVGAGPAGLAAVGSAVGGGMAAGAVTVVAAPVVVAALVGGAVYWLISE